MKARVAAGVRRERLRVAHGIHPVLCLVLSTTAWALVSCTEPSTNGADSPTGGAAVMGDTMGGSSTAGGVSASGGAPGQPPSLVDDFTAEGGTPDCAPLRVAVEPVTPESAGDAGVQPESSSLGDASVPLGCDFEMEPPATGDVVDPQEVVVALALQGVDERRLPRVTNAADCSGQAWYFTDPRFNLALVSLCPESCEAFFGSDSARLVALLGCPP